MRRAKTENPDQLVFLDGGGCIIVLGLIFSAAGCLFLYLGLTEPITFKKGEPAGIQGTILVVVLSSLFILIGMAVAVSRSGMTFDRKALTVERWWGIWNPWGSALPERGIPAGTRVLSKPRSIQFTKETVVEIGPKVDKLQSSNQKVSVLPVRLKCQPVFSLNEFATELEARHYAEEVALFLGLAIEDCTSDTMVRREADTLGVPLPELVQKLTSTSSLPLPPEDMRIGFQAEGERGTFTAPRQPFGLFLVIYLAAPFLFSLGICYFLYRDVSRGEMTPEQHASFVRVVTLVMIFPMLFGLVGLFTGVYWGGELEVTHTGLRITTRRKLFGGSVFMGADELEEVRVVKINSSKRISVAGFSISEDPDTENFELQLIGKERIVRFGQYQSRSELEWVREVVLKSIAV